MFRLSMDFVIKNKDLPEELILMLSVIRKELNRKPGGFAKPTIISDKLCDFLGKAHGTEMSMIEVTKEITKYIKQFNLEDEKNRRIILPDQKLKTLLNIQEEQLEILTYSIFKNI
jgi:chromatin remodeling complex protein RSC6